jgi:nitrate reductase gamma subunit
MGENMFNTIFAISQDWIWEARREAYWPSSIELYGKQIGFLIYLCAAIAVIVLLIGFIRNMRVWFQGRYDEEEQTFFNFLFVLIKRGFKNIFSRTFPRRLYYGIGAGILKRKSMQRSSFIIHTMIMVGFIGSAIATTAITIHEYIFHEELLVGPLYLLLNIGADVAGTLLFIGVVSAFIRRFSRDKTYYEQAGVEDLVLLLLLFWISLSGFFVEAARILYGLNHLPLVI